MSYSTIAVTPGSGSNITVDAVSGNNIQIVKLDFGASGSSLPAVADGSGFLKVNIAGQALSAITVNNSTASNLKVDASGATVPISAASAIPVSAAANAPVAVQLSNGSTSISTLPVSGTVTANQGTANTNANAWPIKISDGTNTAPLDASNSNALKVSVVASVGPGQQDDKTIFTEGTTPINVIGADYNTSTSVPSSGQAAALQMTQYRGLHTNLRNSSGTEIATSSNPLYSNVSQIGGHTVATASNGLQQVSVTDSSGSNFSNANPMPVYPAPSPATFWSQHVAYTASQTAQTIRTPTSGKTSYVQGFIIIPTGAGTLEIFDGTAGATADLLNGTMPSSGVFSINFDPPRPLSAVNNVLKYTSGSGSTGDITARGYEL